MDVCGFPCGETTVNKQSCMRNSLSFRERDLGDGEEEIMENDNGED